MRKNLLTIISLFAVTFSFSQPITVITTDVVPLGKTVYQANDTLPSLSILPGGMGNQTWIFSTLNNHYADTMMFMNPSSFPNANLFPSSNIGYQMNYVNSSWGFLQNNSTGLYVIGQSGDFLSSGNTIAVYFSNALTLVKFPATYNDIGSDTTVYQLKDILTGSPGVDSVLIKHNGTSSYKIDAYGNMTTPLGTFNSIRQSETKHGHDSIFVRLISPPMWIYAQESFDTSYIFRWWTNAPNVGFPIVELTFDSIAMKGVLVSWLLTTPVNTNIAENSFSHDTNIFPNPASDVLNFSILNSFNTLIKVYDINGKEILSTPVTGTVTKFSTSSFVNGIYLYRMVNAEGKEIKGGKFVVNR